MKKVFLIILCCIFTLGLTGCSIKNLKEKKLIDTVWIQVDKNNSDFTHTYKVYKENMAKMISVNIIKIKLIFPI